MSFVRHQYASASTCISAAGSNVATSQRSTAGMPVHAVACCCVATSSNGVSRSFMPCTYPEAGCRMDQMYKIRSIARWISGCWKKGMSGHVRGKSTWICRNVSPSCVVRS